MSAPYQALLIVSFGGPEGPDDVIPFLENVLRGKNVPRERMLEVAEHYHHFGGVSPINGQNRELIAALRQAFASEGPALPIYWGNRNWHPLLPDTIAQMAADGIERALAYTTSAYSSYSGCRQYLDNVAVAQAAVGARAPQIDKLRLFFNHPLYVEALTERLAAALGSYPAEQHGQVEVLFTAHSVPVTMAEGSRYQPQLLDTAETLAARLGLQKWQLVYQSRSGPPTQPWLEPDVLEAIRAAHARGTRQLVVAPIGFLSDHMEVLYDLDCEARQLCYELGITMVRAATVGTHPLLVQMIRELVLERQEGRTIRPAVGKFPASSDFCEVGCCPSPQRPGTPPPDRG